MNRPAHIDADVMGPDEYPADVTVSDEGYWGVYELLTDEQYDEWRTYTPPEEWPPTDPHGNVYDIFFTADEIERTYGMLTSGAARFDPFGGMLQPATHDHPGCEYCNTPLHDWRDRYPQIRFCSIVCREDWSDTGRCNNHKNHDALMKTAEERMQSGLFSKTIDHAYAKLDSWQQLFGWGLFESLMGESVYEFGVEYKARTFDFSESEFQPPDCNEDGTLDVRVGFPTDYLDESLSLFVAAMMGVQMVSVQPRIMGTETNENGEETSRMMESKTVEAAQLTAPPSEHDPTPQQFKTLETWSEHHLNLPLSRLVRDRKDMLEMGGVTTDPEQSDENDVNDDIVVEIQADGDEITTKSTDARDPNQFEDNTPVTEDIADNIDAQ